MRSSDPAKAGADELMELEFYNITVMTGQASRMKTTAGDLRE
jgi:hypothetical protein